MHSQNNATGVVHPSALTGFSQAELYEKTRPSYPPDAVKQMAKVLKLAPAPAAKKLVVEVGPGTGLFTRCFVDNGLFAGSPAAAASSHVEFLGIEPNKGMREAFQDLFPALPCVDGSASGLPCKDASVDAVIAAQAFHWFADLPTLREFHRVLHPGGVVGLIWNLEDGNVPWIKELRDYYESFENNHPQYRTGKWVNVFNEPEAKQLFAPLQRSFFNHSITSSVEIAVDRVLSRSYMQLLDDQKREGVRAELTKMLKRQEKNGEVFMPLVCEVAWFEKK